MTLGFFVSTEMRCGTSLVVYSCLWVSSHSVFWFVVGIFWGYVEVINVSVFSTGMFAFLAACSSWLSMVTSVSFCC